VNEDSKTRDLVLNKTFTELCELASKDDLENRRAYQARINEYVSQIVNIINSELAIFNESFESLLEIYKRNKETSEDDSDSDDEDDMSHSLLTENEANELINRFRLTNRSWADYSLLGGSYGSLNKEYGGRKGIYEINHLPPENSYKGTRYSKITYNQMPAHLMKYEHHRLYPTTGTRNFPKYNPLENWSSGAYRFMLKFLMGFSFAAALRLELRILFLLFPENYENLYGPGALHLINYCRKKIKGAPCNSDCPKYGQH
jgi:hypothetical protein